MIRIDSAYFRPTEVPFLLGLLDKKGADEVGLGACLYAGYVD